MTDKRMTHTDLEVLYLALKSSMMDGAGEWRKYLNQVEQKMAQDAFYKLERLLLTGQPIKYDVPQSE